MVLLDFRRKLAAGEGGQVCTGPNVAHPPATDGSDGGASDADEPGTSHGADAAESDLTWLIVGWLGCWGLVVVGIVGGCVGWGAH